MPGATGIDVVEAAARQAPGLPVILLTAFGSIDGAVDAVRRGAFDYLTKPLESPDTLRRVVHRAIASRVKAPTDASGPASSVSAIFEDPASKEVLELLRLVASRDTTVLLTGASGTGKEVAAQVIHELSARRGGPFVAINCGAIPPDLFESQLFGHKRGAFTGATSDQPGVFEAADGGTLLLDEVGELPLDSQVKLLRALQERQIRRLGESAARPIDVRVVAATLRNLPTDVQSGRFRSDLYYRLSVFPIALPKLQQRPLDIVPLARQALTQLGEPDRPVTAAAQRLLMAHSWPGNVRELNNTLERALLLAKDGPIDTAHIRLNAASAPTSTVGMGGSLKELERQAISEALVRHAGNRKRAAEQLGIALRTLQYKIKEYGLNR